MINSIICNNCAGGAILHEYGMEFKTPTINLQILPEQFPKFCKNIVYYLNLDIKECRKLYPYHIAMLEKMFGGIPDMPYGIIDNDILVCFQHYGTFEEAKQKWDERKAKVDYDHIGYLFHARGEEYRVEAEVFSRLPLNSLTLTEGFDIDNGIRFDGDGFGALNGKLRITQVYDYGRWLND